MGVASRARISGADGSTVQSGATKRPTPSTPAKRGKGVTNRPNLSQTETKMGPEQDELNAKRLLEACPTAPNRSNADQSNPVGQRDKRARDESERVNEIARLASVTLRAKPFLPFSLVRPRTAPDPATQTRGSDAATQNCVGRSCMVVFRQLWQCDTVQINCRTTVERCSG